MEREHGCADLCNGAGFSCLPLGVVVVVRWLFSKRQFLVLIVITAVVDGVARVAVIVEILVVVGIDDLVVV